MVSSESTGGNPFQEVCIYLSQQGNDLAIAELIKRFGFTVYAFISLSRLRKHLEAHPLTAAVFLQGNLQELEPVIRQSYHGPLYELSPEREAMLETLGEHLREVHRNQMRVQDPRVIRVLKAIDAFTQGAQKTLLVLGSAESLQRAREFIAMFYPGTLSEIDDTLPEDIPAHGSFLTMNLFGRPLAWQQRWNFIFGTSELPHVILEGRTTDDLDGLYLRGEVDEMLYERLSFRQIDATQLANYSLEELAVQPLQKSDPRLIFDAEGEPAAASVVSTTREEKRAKGGTRGLFGRFLKR